MTVLLCLFSGPSLAVYPGWPRTHPVNQTGLRLRDPHQAAFASQVLEIKVSNTTPSMTVLFCFVFKEKAKVLEIKNLSKVRILQSDKNKHHREAPLSFSA